MELGLLTGSTLVMWAQLIKSSLICLDPAGTQLMPYCIPGGHFASYGDLEKGA